MKSSYLSMHMWENVFNIVGAHFVFLKDIIKYGPASLPLNTLLFLSQMLSCFQHIYFM